MSFDSGIIYIYYIVVALVIFTIFLVEQNANQALHVADRGYVMENGVITISDSAENLLKNQDIQKAYLGI